MSLQWHRQGNSSSSPQAQSKWYAVTNLAACFAYFISGRHSDSNNLTIPAFAVVLACRDETRGEQLRVALEANAKEHGNSKPQAEVMLLDVSSLQSVRSFVQRWNQQQRPLHCLINNAGIFDIGGSKPGCLSLSLLWLLLSATPDVFMNSYIGMHTPLCMSVPCDTVPQAKQACRDQGLSLHFWARQAAMILSCVI